MLEFDNQYKLFSTETFAYQLAIKTVHLYINKQNGLWLKLHPHKKVLRNILWQYIYASTNNQPRSGLILYLLKWIDMYCLIPTIKLASIQLSTNNMAESCPICLEVVDSNMIEKDMRKVYYEKDIYIVWCRGVARHKYHIGCYVEFLNAEEQKDKNKQYKCESDTLCIVCYSPIHLPLFYGTIY